MLVYLATRGTLTTVGGAAHGQEEQRTSRTTKHRKSHQSRCSIRTVLYTLVTSHWGTTLRSLHGSRGQHGVAQQRYSRESVETRQVNNHHHHHHVFAASHTRSTLPSVHGQHRDIPCSETAPRPRPSLVVLFQQSSLADKAAVKLFDPSFV